MNRFQAYIFDLDGTLLDTLADLAASCNHALEACAMPPRSIDEVRQFVGNGVRVLMQRAVPQGEENPLFEQALDCFRKHYLIHGQDNTAPYPGIVDMLVSLRRHGVRIAVVSNKFDAATKQLCNHYFPDLVDVAIGECEGIHRKPAPDTVNEAMKQLGVNRHAVVYVGDSDTDILTARNAGIPCLSVTWGFRDRQFLLDHGATALIASPEEIIRIPHSL